jgi:polar amino acid transport system ATP-binding protein
MSMLKIDCLSKSFGEKVIIKNVSLEIQKGEIVGLAGHSGSGKSTLLRCIQGIEKQTLGTIDLLGRVTFMFQDFQLFPHFSVLKNLIYAPSLHDKNIDHSIKARELLDKLGIKDKESEYPEKLSGGQKQRVAFARCLMMNPDILLCDEPTSGLDIVSTKDIISLIKSVKEMGVTMIIASHNLDFLTEISDRIIVLKNGEIQETADPREIKDPVEYLKSFY